MLFSFDLGVNWTLVAVKPWRKPPDYVAWHVDRDTWKIKMTPPSSSPLSSFMLSFTQSLSLFSLLLLFLLSIKVILAVTPPQSVSVTRRQLFAATDDCLLAHKVNKNGVFRILKDRIVQLLTFSFFMIFN